MAMRYAVYYEGGGMWTAASERPWDGRPTAEFERAAFAAAAWANLHDPILEWSERKQVYEMMRTRDAEIKAQTDAKRRKTLIALDALMLGEN
jgi:hypothetical protein